MKGDNTMEADRYRRELERKDRDISSVDEAIERIFAEEKRCQDVIDQRTRDLRNCKSESITKSRQRDIDTQKSKIAALEKDRERRMMERKRLCRDRENLNQRLQYELQREVDAQRREVAEQQHKEADRAYWERERQRKEQKEQNDRRRQQHTHVHERTTEQIARRKWQRGWCANTNRSIRFLLKSSCASCWLYWQHCGCFGY